MPSASSTGLSFVELAWRHLASRWESSVGAALALLLALLPAGLVLVDRSGARSDLHTVVANSDGFTVQRSGVADAATFDAFQRQAQGQVAPRLGQYLDSGSARATAAPFRLVSVGGREPSGPLAAADASVLYVADLQSRVDIVQGLAPKPGAGGGELMATMPVTQADRIGAQLFDVVCVDIAPPAPPSAAPWCARLVGLWRPKAGADPAWTGPNAQLRVFADHDDFFAAAALQPAQGVTASRQYAPRAGAITPQDAGAVAQRIGDARRAIAAGGAGQVRTSLDTTLAHYASTSYTSLPVELLAAALVPLLTLLAVVMAGWYVEPRLHELALLRARGWTGRRVRRLVLSELVLLGAPAFTVAVIGMLAVLWQAADGAIGSRPVALSSGELLAIGVAAAVLVIAAIRFVRLATWASQQSVLRLDDPQERATGLLPWRGADGTVLLAVPAAVLLIVPRLAGAGGWRLPGPLDDLGSLVLSVAGLVLLGLAALPALSLAAEMLLSRGALEGAMAHVQLRRWWQRNGPAGLLVVIAFAVASYAFVALVDQALAGPGGATGQGIAASLTIGLLSALATALLVYGMVFLVTCRARVDYYAALLVDGLPATTVKRSVEIEQQVVLLLGLVVGLVIGLVLVAATGTSIGLAGQAGALATAPQPAALIAGVAGTAATGVLGGLTIAWLVRRNVVDFRLVERSWRGT